MGDQFKFLSCSPKIKTSQCFTTSSSPPSPWPPPEKTRCLSTRGCASTPWRQSSSTAGTDMGMKMAEAAITCRAYDVPTMRKKKPNKGKEKKPNKGKGKNKPMKCPSI